MNSTKRFDVVRARAPLRLGLAGGGTDVSPYCDDFGGAVLNVTIQRFAYAFVQMNDMGHLEFRSSDLGQVETLPLQSQVSIDRGMRLHRATYNRIIRDFRRGDPLALTVTTHADAPAGSGLGTSSALVVALVDAFRAFLDLPLGRHDVARLAFEIERQDLALEGGRQDQYAAAWGGANFMEFLANDRVIVNPLRLSDGCLDELEASMLTCFTGQSRESSNIIREQSTHMTSRTTVVIDALHQLKADAIAMKEALLRGNLPSMAEIMTRSWEAKKQTAKSVSNNLIDDIYRFALQNGAMAGKVSGAGGGGFIMFLATPEGRPKLIRELTAKGINAQAIQLNDKGCETWKKPF